MTVYGTAVLLSLSGGLVALGAMLGTPRLVNPVGRTTPDVTTSGTPGRPAAPPGSTGLGGNTGEPADSGPGAARPATDGVGVPPGGAHPGRGAGVLATPPVGGGPPTANGMPAGGTPAPPQRAVTVRYETETTEIPYRTRAVRDPSMRRGTREERTAGVPGHRRLRYRVATVDGQRADRRLVESTVIREPVTRVVAVGTRNGNGRPDRGCRDGRHEGAGYGGGEGAGYGSEEHAASGGDGDDGDDKRGGNGRCD